MEEPESILDAIYGDDDDDVVVEGGDDVEMLDVEEGELVEQNPQTDIGQSGGGGGGDGRNESLENQSSQNKNRRRRANKKRNKRKRAGAPGANVTDINRFVLDTCRRLKEKKSYMVYTAVGCLGVSALSDLVKEVDAIQSCGGQMTADGRRSRTGGGILWSIIKAKEPMAYKEIMKKAKEFEKQFKQQNMHQGSWQNKEVSSQETATALFKGSAASVPNHTDPVRQNQQQQSTTEGKVRSAHDRIRVPVSYEDLAGEDGKNV